MRGERDTLRVTDAAPLSMVVVDDETFMARSLRRSLQAYFPSSTVKTFVDPYRAVSYIVESPPDVVVTDFDMPRCDGFELAQSLRRTMGPTCPRIILVSGSRVPKSKLTEFDAFFEKPLEFSQLASAIRHLRSKRVSCVRTRTVDLADD